MSSLKGTEQLESSGDPKDSDVATPRDVQPPEFDPYQSHLSDDTRYRHSESPRPTDMMRGLGVYEPTCVKTGK